MSRAFRFLVGARDTLYETGVLQSYHLNHPVISVGNITVGGTGKTPLVILLAEAFLKQGFRPVVLSRGYKRKSAGIVVVSKGNGPLVPWQVAGDEPYLIARRVKDAAVVVGADRYTAGLAAQKSDLGDLFILDDGFQHRRLHRDIDLVTIDPTEWMAGEKLFPYGRWREPQEALERADAAIVQATPEGFPQLPIPTFAIETVLDGIYRGSEPIRLETLKNRSVTAFAGIAKPHRFFAALEGMGVTLSKRVGFRDHYTYMRQDIDNLGGEFQITTEKDAVKLESMGAGDFLHLRISANIPQFEELLKLIRERIYLPHSKEETQS
jgi:tetraacyldisaccharide 4'-kinase